MGLKEILAKQVSLLQVEPDEALRRQTAEMILNGVVGVHQETDLLKQAFSACSEAMGPADAKIRETVLKMLYKARNSETRQVLLDVLPITVTEQDTEQVLRCLRVVLEQSDTLLPVLECLAQLRLGEGGRAETIQMVIKAMSFASATEFPDVVRELLCQVSSAREAVAALAAIREEIRRFPKEDSLVAQYIVAAVSDTAHGDAIAAAFLELLKDIESDDEDFVMRLDLTILLTLSQQFSKSTDRILDSWLTRKTFPFDSLDSLVDTISSGELLYSRIAAALVRMAIFLLLAPARVTQAISQTSAVHNFILKLKNRLDRTREAELLSSILHLSEETAGFGVEMGGKRKFADNCNSQRVVHQSVNKLLKQLANIDPGALLRFKHVLTRRLTSCVASDVKSIQELCSILTSLVDDHGSLELMTLLQKLLFSSSFGIQGDASKVVKGILLGTELIRRQRISGRDKACIKDWILRLLLPATRRMVDPELGTPGLRFLQAWTEFDGNRKDGFHHFKMILANTGLIQMLANYQKSKRSDVILGYTELPPEFQLVAQTGKTRDMLFCINFFLRHSNMANPERWGHATQYVFELVDTYLWIGRGEAGNWRPDGWLNASAEFPAIFIPFNSTDKKQTSAITWIKSYLCCFDLAKNPTRGDDTLPSMSDVAETSVASLNTRHLRRFQASVSRFSLSLLIGIAMSAAVLKHAFQHMKDLKCADGGSQLTIADCGLLRLLKLQMIKIYDLRSKSIVVDEFLVSLEAAVRRSLSKSKRAAVGLQGDRRESLVEPVSAGDCLVEHERILSSIGIAISHTQCIRKEMFVFRRNISIGVLWECLVDPVDRASTRRCLLSLATEMKSGPPDASSLAAFRLMNLSVNVLQHIISLVTNQSRVSEFSGANKVVLVHVVGECYFLLDILPTLRRGYFALQQPRDANSHVSLSVVVEQATSYVRLLALLLQDVSCGRVGFPSFDECLAWCELEEGTTQLIADTTSSPTIRLSRLFGAFSARLRVADNSRVAAALLDILSVFAFNANDVLVGKLLELSWSSLHTVYAHTEASVDQKDLPFALVETMSRFGVSTASYDLQTLRGVLERIVHKVWKADDSLDSLRHLRHGMLRHWGVMAASPGRLSSHVKEMSALVAELSSLLDSFGHNVGNDCGGEEKKESEKSRPKKRKPTETPSIVGLEAATFPDYFAIVLSMVVGFSAQSAAGLPRGDSKSPFHHLEEQFTLFRSLIELYRRHFTIFPRKSATVVATASKEMLVVSTAQLQRCVDWRNSQPLLSVAEREANKHDPGAILFLQRLLDTMAANTAGAMESLCEFWQSQQGSHVMPARSNSLRFAAEKAARRMKDVAASHNLTPPTFDSAPGAIEFGHSPKHAQGFHNIEPLDVQSEQRRMLDELESQQVEVPTSDEEIDDSDGSFGVAGDWGDDVESEESAIGLDIQSDNFLLLRR